jgi:hypothetical protein
MMEMGRHLRWVVLAATLGGILLLLLHPGFRRAAILRSNEGFFSQLDQVEQAEEAESAEETEKAP